MPDTPDNPIVYGEPLPLAMDAALPRERNRTMVLLPKKPLARPRVARDEEGDADYSTLISFLEDKLEAGDLAKVRRMLGLDHPDLEGEPGGASDAAIEREQLTLQARHRAGHITEGQLVAGMQDIRRRRASRTVVQDGRSVVSPLDKLEAEFPHMNRLKR